MRVDGTGDDLDVDGSELLDAVVKGQNLGGTDEGEGQGVEEKDKIFATIV